MDGKARDIFQYQWGQTRSPWDRCVTCWSHPPYFSEGGKSYDVSHDDTVTL